MRKFIVFLLFAALIIGGLIVGKDLIAKTALEKGVKAATGLEMSVDSVKVGLLDTYVDVKELKVKNPASFKEKDMAYLPRIYIDYDLGDIIKRFFHFQEIELNLKKLVVLRDKEGQLNIGSLKMVEKEEKKAEPSKEEKKQTKMPEFQVDLLTLKIGKVIYKDTSAGQARVREFNVNLDEQYKDITDFQKFSKLILVKALSSTSISSLTGFDLDSLQGQVSGINAVSGLKESLQGLKDSAGQVVEESGEAVDKAVDEAVEKSKKALGDLFDRGQ